MTEANEPSKSKSISDVLVNILQIIVSLTTTLGIIGLVFGIFHSYRYLSKIGYVSIFPDILSQSSVLIAVLIPIFIYSLLYIVQLFSPYIFYLNIDIREDESGKIAGISSLLILNSILYLIACILIAQKNFDLLVFFCFLPIYSFIILFIFCKKNHKSKKSSHLLLKIKKYFANFVVFIISIFLYIFTLTGTYYILYFAGGMDYILIVILVSTYWMVSFFAYDGLKSIDNNLFNKNIIFVIKCYFSFCLIFIFYSLSIYGFGINSLYTTRLIEKPQDASWYLIHSNNAQETINGLSLADISKIKHNFKMNSDENSDENSKVYSHNLDKNPQALYGCMAWNAGKTKIFCPDSFDNFNVKDNSESKCLVIDADNLQLMPDAYFK